MLRSLISGVRALLHPMKRNVQIEDELKSFFEDSVEDKVRRGMSPEEARRAARIEIGSREMVRHKVWSAGWESWVDSFVRDLRFAARQIKKSPGFTAVTVLTLGLGIGANTAIFLLTYSLLLKSLPVPDPGRLVRYSAFSQDGDHAISYRLYEALREHPGPTSGLFAWDDSDAELDEGSSSSQIPVGLATGSVFRVLELRPYLGQGFEETAGEPGEPLEHEALVSYSYWKSHFSSDPHILGRTIELNRTEITIVGVLPRGFEGIAPEHRDDLLLPLSFERVIDGKFALIDQAGAFWLTVMGRLQPGATLQQARSTLTATARLDFDTADPQHEVLNNDLFGGGYRLGVVAGRTGQSWLRRQYDQPLKVLEGLCALMILLCAVNVALLVLARVSSRLHEFAVRSALGAARSRLMSQVLMETALLGPAGLALGGYLGWELAHALVTIITKIGDQPALNLQAGAAIILFAVTLSLGAALLAGLWPAWRASHTAPALDLKQVRTQTRTGHLGRWLIPAQVALGVVLIYAALLMTGTLRNYLKENSGFEPDGVTFGELNFQNPDPSDQGQVRKAYAIAEALRHQPGIESAALLSLPPVRGWSTINGYRSRGPNGEVRSSDDIWNQEGTQGYFATLGTKILEGRGFDSEDIGGDIVCVISRSAANFFFPGQDPIGQFITEGNGQPPKGEAAKEPPATYRVIGVAENARIGSLAKPAPMALYDFYAQDKHPWTPSLVAVRSSNDGLAAAAIRREAAQILPGALPPKVYTFDQAVDANLSRERLLSSVSGGFALLALALVGAGLYGVLSRAVTERRREIGIRMALGAERKRIVGALARSAAIRIGIGVVAGAVLAALAGRLMKSLLYGVSAGSPLVALATLGLLLAVLTTAFVLPAGRAASIQPMEAIREE
jgi:predicted permease